MVDMAHQYRRNGHFCTVDADGDRGAAREALVRTRRSCFCTRSSIPRSSRIPCSSGLVEVGEYGSPTARHDCRSNKDHTARAIGCLTLVGLKGSQKQGHPPPNPSSNLMDDSIWRSWVCGLFGSRIRWTWC